MLPLSHREFQDEKKYIPPSYDQKFVISLMLLCRPSLRRFVPLKNVKVVAVNALPFAGGAIRPDHADFGLGHVTQPKMPPAILAAGTSAAHEDFTAHHRLAALHFKPGANRIAVSTGLLQLDLDPVARIGAGVAPDLGTFPAVDDHQIQQAVHVEIRQGSATRYGHVGNTCRLA